MSKQTGHVQRPSDQARRKESTRRDMLRHSPTNSGGKHERMEKKSLNLSGYQKYSNNQYEDEIRKEQRKEPNFGGNYAYDDRKRNEERVYRKEPMTDKNWNPKYVREERERHDDRGRGGFQESDEERYISKNVEETITDIARVVKKRRMDLKNIQNEISVKSYNGKGLATYANVRSYFGSSLFDIRSRDLGEMLEAFAYEDQNQFRSTKAKRHYKDIEGQIDLGALLQAISRAAYGGHDKESKQHIDDFNRGNKKAMKLQKALKHYGLVKSYSLTALFRTIDKDHSDTLDVNEFAKLLKQLTKLGYDVDYRDAPDIFHIIDANNDQRVSMQEFTNFLNNNILKDSINDPSHSLYQIFEQIRKHLSIKGVSVAELFNVNSYQVDMNNHGNQGNYVPWLDFLSVLTKQLQVYPLPKDIPLLKEMLEDSLQKDAVNMLDFMDMLGIDSQGYNEAQYSQFQQVINKIRSECQGLRQNFSQSYEYLKKLARMLDSKRISGNSLRIEFRGGLNMSQNNYQFGQFGQQNKFGHQQMNTSSWIDQKAFTDALERVLQLGYNQNFGNNSSGDQDLIRNVGMSFLNSRNQVDYEIFIEVYEMLAVVHRHYQYIMQSFHSAMEQQNCFTLRDLFGQINLPTMGPIQKNQFSHSVRQIGVQQADGQMLDQFIMYIGSEVKADSFHFHDLDNEFATFMHETNRMIRGQPYNNQGGGFNQPNMNNPGNNWGNNNNNYNNQPNNNNGQYNMPNPNFGGIQAPTPAMDNALREYRTELTSIAQGIADRNSTVRQFFSQHRQSKAGGFQQQSFMTADTSPIDSWDFEAGVKALKLSTRTWRVGPRELFKKLLDDRQNTINLDALENFFNQLLQTGVEKDPQADILFEHIVRAYRADGNYVQYTARLAEDKRMNEAVRQIESDIMQKLKNSGKSVTTRDIEKCLVQFASHPGRKSMFSGQAFMQNFSQKAYSLHIQPGKFERGGDGFGMSDMTEEDRMVDGVLQQFKIVIEQRRINVEKELQKIERKERDIQEYDRNAKLIGKIKIRKLISFMTELGFNFRSNQEGRAFGDHYGQPKTELADYGAFLADLQRPTGTDLAPVHQMDGEDEIKEVDERMVRDMLMRLQAAFKRTRRDIRRELEDAEQRHKGYNAKLNGYLEKDHFFQIIEGDNTVLFQDYEHAMLIAKYQGKDFALKGQIYYKGLCKDVEELEGGGKKSPELIETLQDCFRKARNYNSDIRDLYQNLSRKENQINRTKNDDFGYQRDTAKTYELPEDDFYKVLKDNGIKLTDKQMDHLNKRYFSGSSNNVKILYKAFFKDLEGCMELQVVQETSNLSREQKTAYDHILKLLEKQKMVNKFVAKLKRRDKDEVNMIKTDDLKEALEDIGAAQSKREWEYILKPLKISKTQQVDISMFLTYVFNNDKRTVENLMNMSISQLEKGSSGDGEVRSNEFVCPKYTKNAHSAGLNSIGKKFINRQGNYEDWMMSNLPATVKDRTNPSISRKWFMELCQNAGLDIDMKESSALEDFFVKFMNNQSEVKLTKLLTAFGLPPQTINKTYTIGEGKPKPVHILSEDEKETCHFILNKIRKRCRNEDLDIDRMIISRLKKDQNSDHVQGLSFLEIIQEKLGKKFTVELELKKNIEDVTLYLAEQQPQLISLKKLALALKSNQSAPLKQDLIEKEIIYQNEIKEVLKTKERERTAKKLAKHMKDKGFAFTDLLSQFNKDSTEITRPAFRERLAKLQFKTTEEELNDLYKVMSTGSKKTLDVKLIKDLMKQVKPGHTTSDGKAVSRLSTASQNVRNCIDIIQKNLVKERMDAAEFFDYLDGDKSGDIDRYEFVNGIDLMNIQLIKRHELKELFDFMDENGDENLSRDEFSNYIKGAEKTADEKIRALPEDLKREMKNNIRELFNQMDEDDNQKLDVHELFHAYQSMGMHRDFDEVKEQIYKATSGKDFLTLEQFTQMMQPVILETYLNAVKSEEDLRRIFRENDTDYSGFLDVVELAEAIRSMGNIEITPDEVANLMAEADHDRNMQLDIEEFVTFFTMGGDMQFKEKENARKFSEIQMARRLTPADFFKAFKGMPTNFVKSFIGSTWVEGRCFPSSVFKAQVDPKTMLWKDLYTCSERDLRGMNLTKDQEPFIRPIKTKIGAFITLVEAAGVVSQNSESKSDISKDIKLRAIRACVMHKPHKRNQLIFNSVQAPAFYDKKNSDIWVMGEDSRNPGGHMSTLAFRSIEMDLEELKKQQCSIVFELMIGIQKGGDDQMNEMCCGWAELPLSELDRSQTIRLDIKGGSPMAQTQIKKEDVKQERSGYRYFTSLLTGSNSGLTIKIDPYSRLAEDKRYHMDLMPGTCLLHAELLSFISAFMNYKGKIFLNSNSDTGQHLGSMALKKPPGDIIISTFPKLLDNPDICECMALCWKEDVTSKFSSSNSRNINVITDQMKDFVSRLYPIMYTTDIRNFMRKYGDTSSICYDADMLKTIQKLAKAALRYKSSRQVDARNIEKQAPSALELTEFTPFNINEYDYQIWDTVQARRDEFQKRHIN